MPKYPYINTHRRNFVPLSQDGSELKAKLSSLSKYLPKLISKYHIAAAGGTIRKILENGNRYGYNDIDFFFYGIDQETAHNELSRICEKFKKLGANIVYSKYVTTITPNRESDPDGLPMQFVHRIYPSLDLIIGGFDLGNSAILYCKDGFYATPFGAFCIANNMNILDTSRRSITYERRLLKYHTKLRSRIVILSTNYDIINKYLSSTYGFTINISKYLKVNYQYRRDYHNRNVTERLLTIDGNIENLIAGNSDYEIDPEYVKELGGVRNIGCILNNDMSKLTWTDNSIYLQYPACLEDKHNYGFYYQMARLLYRGYCTTRTQTIQRYIYYIGKELFYEIFSECKNEYLKKQLKNEELRHNDVFKAAQAKAYNALCERLVRLDNTVKLEEQINRDGPLSIISWITKNPGRQWTSSVNPIFTNPRDYYFQEIYVGYTVGFIPGVETLIRLLVKNRIGVWSNISTDTMNHIFNHLAHIMIGKTIQKNLL